MYRMLKPGNHQMLEKGSPFVFFLCGNEKPATKVSSTIQSCMSFLTAWLTDLAPQAHLHLSFLPGESESDSENERR